MGTGFHVLDSLKLQVSQMQTHSSSTVGRQLDQQGPNLSQLCSIASSR